MYKMHQLTSRVRVGITSPGELNIEVYDRDRDDPESNMEEIFVPADALSDLFEFLRRNT